LFAEAEIPPIRILDPEYASYVDTLRPIANDQSVLGISSSDLPQDRLQQSIYDALMQLKPMDLSPLFRFGRVVRKYCYRVKSLFDKDFEKMDGPSLASLLAKLVSGRKSSKVQTPVAQRKSVSSLQDQPVLSAATQMHLNSLQAINTRTLYQSDGIIVIAFQIPGFDHAIALKESRRDTASNEVAMIRLLPNARFLPSVQSCEWFSEVRSSMIVTELLVDTCPDVGSDFLSRSLDHARFMRDLIESLLFLHSHRIIHRDISPRNAMYSAKDCRYKLIDFEFACLLPKGHDTVVDQYIVGTDGYIDPFACETKRYSFTSDWYSLGRVCTDRISHDMLINLDEWNSDLTISDLFNDLFRIASSMVNCRKTPVEVAQLLLDVNSIIGRFPAKEPSISRRIPSLVKHAPAILIQ
jgi:serine/threonine protein kinase